jgi:hypothetical protein
MSQHLKRCDCAVRKPAMSFWIAVETKSTLRRLAL